MRWETSRRLTFVSTGSLVVAAMLATGMGQSRAESAGLYGQALDTLKQSLQEGQPWERVHAAEALIKQGYFADLREGFQTEEQVAEPPYRIGVWRVLARAYGNNESLRRGYIEKIRKVFLEPSAPDREHALESLAKLGDRQRLEEVQQLAGQSEGTLPVYARWVLANSGRPEDETNLAELLDSEDPKVRQGTAYALSHLKNLQVSTVKRLQSTLAGEPAGSKSRIYLMSALYVHSPQSRPSLKEKLENWGGESPEARMEFARTLGQSGQPVDLPFLANWLEDPIRDVRINAAEALLRIARRHHRGLTAIDWTVIALYGVAMLAIGWMVSRRQENTDEYFVGGRRLNSFLVGISLYASLLSSISFLAHPGEMIKYGPVILCGMASLPFAYLIVGYVFIPLLLRLPVTSAYEILEEYLGLRVRLLGSVLFILIRLSWMALLLFVTGKLLVVTLGWEESAIPYVLIMAGAVTTIYTTMGGLRGVVIIDVIQFFILLAGGLLTIGVISYSLGGFGWFPTSWAPHWSNQPFFSPDPRVRATVVGAILSGLIWWVATAGSDQVAVQRYLSTGSVKAARRSFLTNAIADIPVAITLALIGFALLGFFEANPHLLGDGQSLIGDADYIFPYFVANYLPVGIAGLIIVAILAAAMSSLSSGINSISTVVMVDFMERLKGKGAEGNRVSRARRLTFAIGVMAVLGSFIIGNVSGNLQEVAIKTSSLFVVPLFILFFMAFFVRFATPFGATYGALYSFLAAVTVSFWDTITGQPRLSFQWVSVVALMAGMISGPLLSLVPVGNWKWQMATAWVPLMTAAITLLFVTLF